MLPRFADPLSVLSRQATCYMIHQKEAIVNRKSNFFLLLLSSGDPFYIFS